MRSWIGGTSALKALVGRRVGARGAREEVARGARGEVEGSWVVVKATLLTPAILAIRHIIMAV